jgi:dynein heavy chain
LRDFAKVIQGILLFEAKSLLSSNSSKDGSSSSSADNIMLLNSYTIIKLWIHEVYRVYGDRLIEMEDRRKLCDLVKTIVEKDFKEKIENVLSGQRASISFKQTRKDSLIASSTNTNVTDSDLRGLYFGDFMRLKEEKRMYEEIKDVEKMKEVIENYLGDYNSTSKAPMDLVVFSFVIEHLSRISRILKQPNGHGLLIGISGAGRSTVAKLAAHVANYELFQIEMSKKYSFSDWRNDLKVLVRKAGEHGTSMVFLFSDNQIKDEAFLEDVSMLLNSGDVSALFENEERLEIIEKVIKIINISYYL